MGESLDDLQRFDPNAYITALFADFTLDSDMDKLINADIEQMPKDDDLFDID